MDQHSPEEKNGSTGKLSLSLEKKKKQIGLARGHKRSVYYQKNNYLLTKEIPFLVRYRPRCLALPPKNFPSSLIQVRHKGTPKRPYNMQKTRPPEVLGAIFPYPLHKTYKNTFVKHCVCTEYNLFSSEGESS